MKELKSNFILKIFLVILQIALGVVFIYSGFVKAVDPLGSCYKFTDYFNLAFNLPSLAPTSLFLAIMLAATELIAGVMLVFFLKPKIGAWIALGFMILFTPITLYLAIANPVHDCGCFGDALVLTNWETFYKNLVLIAIAIILVVFRKHIIEFVPNKIAILASAIVFISCIAFELITLRHLPIMDFRPYTIGTYIPEKMIYPEDAPRDVYDTKLVYKNTQTGQVEEFDMEHIPTDEIWEWQDTKNVLVSEGYKPPIHDFNMVDTLGNDLTESVLNDNTPVLLLIMHKIEKSDEDGLALLKKFEEYATKKQYHILALTSSNVDKIMEVWQKQNLNIYFAQTDDITLKTVVRANPGIVLLNQGTIKDKWNWRDFDFDN